MNHARKAIGVACFLFALIITGGSVLVWLAPVPADGLTPMQQSLINIADGMIKVSLGAILATLGFAWSLPATSRSGVGTL